MIIADSTIPFASFKPYQGESKDAFLNKKTNMLLDFSTQESLELFGNDQPDEKSKSNLVNFVDYVDRTVTPFGRRLLRKWVS